jgi:hypothetical protein
MHRLIPSTLCLPLFTLHSSAPTIFIQDQRLELRITSIWRKSFQFPHWSVITALGALFLYLAVDWKALIRFYTPCNRLEQYKQKLPELEEASKDSRDVLQEYGKADSIEERIRR